MFAELFSDCSQAPPSLLPPERVASLNFSWCETSDRCQTSAICSFRVQLWIVYAENIKQWLINLILPEVVFKQEKNFVNHIIGKVFSIFKKVKMKKTDLWSSCEDGFAWPLSHEEMVYTAEIFTAIKETHTRLETCLLLLSRTDSVEGFFIH